MTRAELEAALRNLEDAALLCGALYVREPASHDITVCPCANAARYREKIVRRDTLRDRILEEVKL